MSLALDVFSVARDRRGRLLLSGRHGRSAALPRSADPSACADQGGQSRPRPRRAGPAAAGRLAARRAQARSVVWLLVLLAGATVSQLIARVAQRRRRRHDDALGVRRAARRDRPGRGGLDHRRARHLRRGRRLRRLRAAAGAGLGAPRGAGRGADRGRDRRRRDRRAAARRRRAPARHRAAAADERPGVALRVVAGALCAAVAAALAATMFLLPDPAPTLAPAGGGEPRRRPASAIRSPAS